MLPLPDRYSTSVTKYLIIYRDVLVWVPMRSRCQDRSKSGVAYWGKHLCDRRQERSCKKMGEPSDHRVSLIPWEEEEEARLDANVLRPSCSLRQVRFSCVGVLELRFSLERPALGDLPCWVVGWAPKGNMALADTVMVSRAQQLGP